MEPSAEGAAATPPGRPLISGSGPFSGSSDQKIGGSRPPSKLNEQAIAIADAAVAAIYRIANTSYRADSKDTLTKARALAKEALTPEQVVQAVEHVAKPWRGTQYPIRPSTLLQAPRVRTALEDLQARASAPRPAAPAGLTFKVGDVLVDEEGRPVS